MNLFIILYTLSANTVLLFASNLNNVLLIVIDDMRPEIGSYLGTDEALYPNILTPNMDRLAESSAVMRNAYTNYPLCAPSRSSFLTGRRPDTTKVYDLNTYWRYSGGNFTSIPQYFKENGYVSYGAGKIYHGTPDSGGERHDNAYSWSEEFYRPETYDYWVSSNSTWRSVMPNETDTVPLPDELTKDYAISKLAEIAVAETPFFLAVGFLKPHLPFIAPETFYNWYPEEDMYLPEYKHVPINYPDVAWYKMYELMYYDDMINITGYYNTTLPDDEILAMRRGYYACVSFVDSLIGEILETLDSLSLSNNTIVVISSDHGFHLGEHAMWGKCTNHELDITVPLIVKIPGITDNSGMFLDAFVENIDLFPTIVEASGLPLIQQCPEDSSDITLCHEGLSMIPLITGEVEDNKWKDAVFSQYYKFQDTEYTTVMSYNIREENFHYVKWIHFENGTVNWDIVYGSELYDIRLDPNHDRNVVDDPIYANEVERLDERLRQGWRGALP